MTMRIPVVVVAGERGETRSLETGRLRVTTAHPRYFP
jgi:hypothetical protein